MLRTTYSGGVMVRGIAGVLLFLVSTALSAGQLEEGLAAYEQHDYQRAWQLLEPAARQGAVEAQRKLAVMYRHGLGVERSDEKAVYWYTQAASQGHVLAQNSLGVMYQFGLGVKKDPGQARHWLTRAAEQGLTKAQENLGLLLMDSGGDDLKAVHWLLAAANQGSSRAQLNLGLLYLAGRGVERNDKQGMSWVEQAARGGDSRARAAMARAYREGLYGLPKDEALAQRWQK